MYITHKHTDNTYGVAKSVRGIDMQESLSSCFLY